MLLTVCWFIVIINAFNFLDNMDGLSAGMAWICLAFFTVCGLMAGQVFVPALACVLLGAIGGFWAFNFPPARIFMGDAGSLVIGYFLAIVSVLTTYYQSGHDTPPYALAMPLVILAVPLYDFVTVVTIRIAEGRSPLKGDQRHFSHRLMQRGLDRRLAVLTIYLATATTGLTATLLPGADLRRTITVGVIVVMVLGIVAILESPQRKGRMTQTRTPTSPIADAPAEASFFERVMYFVLLAVLCARPLISESFELVELNFLAALGAGGGVTPAATAWLDSLLLTAAAATLARQWGRFGRARWVLLSLMLLAVAVAASVWAAGNKRIALSAGFSLIVAVITGAALVAVMRTRWMPRLLLAATLATGCTTAAKCFMQKACEFDKTVEYWNEQKAQLGPAGIDPDDPTLVNFERRMLSGETFAYQSHPNVTASMLAMWLLLTAGIVAGGLAARGLKPKEERVLAVALAVATCIALAVALWLTGSTGAIVAAAAGLVLLALLGIWRSFVARHAGRVTAGLVIVYLAVIAAGAGYGIRHGTLPHSSLAFRWYYWTAAARTMEDAPLTGIGRGNFSDAYLLHKPIESTEDVRDPHNLWLSLLVELGPLGFIAGGVLLVGCVGGALRRLNPPETGIPVERCVRLRHTVFAAVGVLMLQGLFSGAFFSVSPAILWAELALVWVLSVLLAVAVLDRLLNSTAACGWVVAGLAAAVGVALVHGLVDFALLTPAGLSLFVLLAACAFALRPGQSHAQQTPAKTVAALAGMVLVIAHLALVTVPIMRAAFRMAQMNNAAAYASTREAALAAVDLGRSALDCDPLDPSLARDTSRVALALAAHLQGTPDLRIELLELAQRFALRWLDRNPKSSAAHAQVATIYEELEDRYLMAARPDESVDALHDAVRHWEAAVALDPMDARRQIATGEVCFQWWEETDESSWAYAAGEHFAAAPAHRRHASARRGHSAARQRAGDRLPPPAPTGRGGLRSADRVGPGNVARSRAVTLRRPAEPGTDLRFAVRGTN